MYNPQELQRKAQLNLHGVDTNAQTNLSKNVTATSEENEQGWFTRGLATVGNVISNILEGAIKSMEGGIDATAMLVGLFGADVDDFVSYDFTGDIFGTDEENEGLLDWTWGKNLEATSYWDNDTMVNQVAEGIGGMLPSIALSAIPYVGGVLSTVSFIASAQGKSSESALRQGAEYDEALIYGGLSGAIEGGIEKISAGIGGFAGKNAGKIFGKQVAKTALGKSAVAFVGEGLEEVASDIIDPQLQRWTGVNENAKVDTNNLFRTFVVGGSVGAVLNGAGRRLSAVSNSSIGGEKFLRIADQVSFIESDINIKESFLSSGKKTQADISKISVTTADDISKRLDNISYNLKLMDETQRLSALEVINRDNSIISNLFDKHGNVKAGVKEQLELSKNRNFSANAILKSQAINEELQRLNEEKGVSVEIDDTPINENERKNLAKFFATKEGLSEKSGENLNFVVVKGKGAEELNGFYSPATKSIYITKDAVNNSLYQTSTHEIKHFVRDGLLEKYLVNSTQNDGAEGKVFKKIVDEIINKKEYGINKQDIDSAIYKKTVGAKLSETEQLAYDELTAHLAEEILGNEEFINRLARSNKGLFNKIRNFISDKVNSKNQSEQYKTAQYLFDKALKEIKDSEQVDNGEEIKYARRTAKYINNRLNVPTLSYIKNELKTLFNGLDSAIADGVAIEMGDTVYVVDSGIEDGKIDFGVRKQSVIDDDKLRKKYIRRKNVEAIRNGYISNGLSSRFGYEYVNYWDNNRQRTSGEKLSTNQGQSTNNKDGISGENGVGGRRGLVDSDGNTLTENQQEFFKNSKIRDKDGNLLVVYHGSPTAGFGVFKTEPFGAWFTEDKNYAIEHTKGLPYNVYKAYLNIKKPFNADNPEMTVHYEQFFNGEEFNEKLLYTKEFRDYLVKQGFDGMIWEHSGYKTVVAFYPNQIKLTTNKKPTRANDIRFSRKQSDGEVTKKLANYTRKKVYSKVEAERTINTILESNFGLEDYNVEISGKTKAEAIDELWKNFNTLDAGKRTGAANKIADYIIDNAVMESYFAEAENDVYTETIDTLRPFLHSIDLSHIREEIKYRGDNSAYLLWGKKKGESGMTADQVAQKLVEQGIRINAETEADIFFEIDEMYRKAVKELKVKTEEQVKDYLSAEDRKQLRGDIAKAILRGYEENGKKSKFAEIVEEQSKNARKWKELYYEEKGRNSAESKLLYQVQKIRDIHFGDFQNASQADNKIFRGSIEKLSAIKNRGDLNKSGTRRIIAGLNTWYNEENPLLNGRYSQEISSALNQIASGEGNLTTAEIRNLTDVVAYFRHFIETANKIYRAGKYIDAMPIAEDYVRKLHDNTKVKLGFFGNLFDKTFNNRKYNYMETFNDPMTIVRYMDKYDNGFFTQTMEEFRDCAVNAAILEMDLNAPLEDFYKKHKTFLKDAGNRMINYNGVQIPAIDAFNCYMALNREEGLLKLAWSGFSWIDEKGNTNRVAGFVTDSDFGYETVKFLANEVQTELEKQFTETDLEYIKIAEDLFNNRCKELKKERDLSRYGYSNVSDNYYIPIAVANVAKSIDVDGWQSEVDRVSNLSFNKATVKGAKNEMLIEPLNVVLSRHLRGIAQYYHLSNAVDNYNIIYNMDTGGNKNKVVSVKSESKNVWQHGEVYMKEMLSDIQGIKKGESSKIFGAVRSGYAKFQLGANPKVWFTQLSSFFASTSILDFSSVVKGLAINTEDVDKYCRLAELRYSDNTAARAQGNLGEIKGDNVVSKTSDLLMKPIGIMDRFVVRELFGACQVQVQKNTGLKVGTEENKVKAGELLKKVILETQQNAIATERSKAMRSTSELMRTLTMFTSDSMKVIGRVIDAYGEITMLKARKRITSDSAELARLDAELKRANKKALKATASLVTQAVFMALIAQAFKTLYNKDDEEENIVENMTVDAIGNLFGGLPLFKDVYAKLVEGYDFDGYQYSAINDLLDSAVNVFDLVGDIFNGSADSRDVMKNIRNLSYALGQLWGIPVRNVYNVITGLINRVSPETGYKINDAFYKQSYSKDLKRAIKNEDEEMIATIAGLIMDENIGSFENSATRKEISRLIGAEYDVLPQTVPSSVTINEETITLTGSQKKAYKEVYSQSITAIDKLVSTNGYKVASDDAKAKAIKYVYKYYYYEAQQKALNIELDSKLYLFGQVIPIDKMALILAEVPTIADKSTNKKQAVQRYLQGAKLTATQKYMLMGYFGYKNTNGKSAVESTINKTSLTKAQKELLLEKCGY